MLHRSIILCVGVSFIVAHAGRAYSGNINGSTIDVSGLPNSTPGNDYITVNLLGFTATNASDVDVVVVGPTGAALVLLGGAGGTSLIGPVNVRFDDTAASGVPANALTTGSFKPTQYVQIGSFPSPGPGLAYDSAATFGTSILGNLNAAGVFTDINLNGAWSLYVMDRNLNDNTELANGWSLTIALPGMSGIPSTFTNSAPIVIPTAPEPGTLALALFGIASITGFWLRRSTGAICSRFSIGK